MLARHNNAREWIAIVSMGCLLTGVALYGLSDIHYASYYNDFPKPVYPEEVAPQILFILGLLLLLLTIILRSFTVRMQASQKHYSFTTLVLRYIALFVFSIVTISQMPLTVRLRPMVKDGVYDFTPTKIIDIHSFPIHSNDTFPLVTFLEVPIYVATYAASVVFYFFIGFVFASLIVDIWKKQRRFVSFTYFIIAGILFLLSLLATNIILNIKSNWIILMLLLWPLENVFPPFILDALFYLLFPVVAMTTGLILVRIAHKPKRWANVQII